MKSRKKLILSLTLLFALNILLILFVHWAPGAQAAAYRQGMSGDAVRQIQEKLKGRGHYEGAVDGIFGAKTVAAVKDFQRKNNLTADGVCGTRTLEALGLRGLSRVPAQSAERTNDLELLARLISAEAGEEPYEGQVAVGGVVLNRLRHPSFPNTLSGVISQPGAFACMTDGRFDRPVDDSARRAARDAMNGVDTSAGALYYYTTAAAEPWLRNRPAVREIGRRVFCK